MSSYNVTVTFSSNRKWTYAAEASTAKEAVRAIRASVRIHIYGRAIRFQAARS